MSNTSIWFIPKLTKEIFTQLTRKCLATRKQDLRKISQFTTANMSKEFQKATCDVFQTKHTIITFQVFLTAWSDTLFQVAITQQKIKLYSV